MVCAPKNLHPSRSKWGSHDFKVAEPNRINITTANSKISLLEVVLETMLDAAMIVNAAGELLHANVKALELNDRLSHEDTAQTTQRHPYPRPNHQTNQLPQAIQPVFDALLESHMQLPPQPVLPEFEVYLADRTPLRIRGQFLDIPRSNLDVPYVLITIENRQESLRSVAIGDAQRFGFTQRETEVWHLRLLGHSYREISTQLFISENTVRKHVKSILAKRRVELDEGL